MSFVACCCPEASIELLELLEGEVEEVGGREGAEERTRGRKGGGA